MVISASRRTDIPCFYSDWFLNRLKEGFVLIRNPMNPGQISKIRLAPETVDCIVFWTKNPAPMLGRLKELEPYPYYFQFALNSYGKDVEEGLPAKNPYILSAFQKLSGQIGKERVIWRYSPALINKKYTMDYHMRYFEKLAKALRGHTEKCMLSFLDFYPSIQGRLEEIGAAALGHEEKVQFARGLRNISDSYGIALESCGEGADLSSAGVAHGKCIDGRLIEKLVGCPVKERKDKGQRPECQCMESIDIGAYSTCLNGCRYCYANHSYPVLEETVKKYDALSPILCGSISQWDTIREREMHSIKERQLRITF